MPAPGRGGTQSSLASKVAWLTRLFRASNAAQSNSKPTPRDITSLQTIFLFEVSDLHKVRIYVQVPQAFSAALHPGLTATLEMPEYPGQQFDATVVTTSHAMNANSRSMLVELQADNGGGKFSAGAYCQVLFQLPSDPDMVRVPATALVSSDQGTQVAVLGAGNKVVIKSVQLGRDFGDSVEVTAGLLPTDQVIDSPPETLQNGDKVQLAVATPSSASTHRRLPTPNS